MGGREKGSPNLPVGLGLHGRVFAPEIAHASLKGTGSETGRRARRLVAYWWPRRVRLLAAFSRGAATRARRSWSGGCRGPRWRLTRTTMLSCSSRTLRGARRPFAFVGPLPVSRGVVATGARAIGHASGTAAAPRGRGASLPCKLQHTISFFSTGLRDTAECIRLQLRRWRIAAARA